MCQKTSDPLHIKSNGKDWSRAVIHRFRRNNTDCLRVYHLCNRPENVVFLLYPYWDGDLFGYVRYWNRSVRSGSPETVQPFSQTILYLIDH